MGGARGRRASKVRTEGHPSEIEPSSTTRRGGRGLDPSTKENLRRAEASLVEELRARMRGERPASGAPAAAAIQQPTRDSLRALSDSELALRSGGGCEVAWSLLYQRSYPCLLGFAYGLGWGGDDAEDLVQETLLRAWENRQDYNPAYSFANWVRTILRRLSTDQKRRKGSWSGVLERSGVEPSECNWMSTSFGDTEREMEVAALSSQLEPILKEMRQEDREILIRVAEGEKVADIAREQGLNATTLRGRAFRARSRFLELYEARYGSTAE